MREWKMERWRERERQTDKYRYRETEKVCERVGIERGTDGVRGRGGKEA